jgi:hypothetical protein
MKAIKQMKDKNIKKIELITSKKIKKLNLLDNKVKMCITKTEKFVNNICDTADKFSPW